MTQEFKVQLLQGFVIKAEFQASIFFRQFGLENGYIKKSKLSIGFTLKFTWIHLLCFTLVLTYLLSNLAIVGFKVDDLMSIWQVIQDPIQERVLSDMKREKLNRW
jgi:hypothetical protein